MTSDSHEGRRPSVLSAATLIPVGVMVAAIVLMVQIFMGGLDVFVTRIEFESYQREEALRQRRTDEILSDIKLQLDRIETLSKGRAR